MMQEYTVEHYIENGKDIFDDWLKNLKDVKGKAAILRTVTKLLDGNFGKNHYCRNGVWELIIDVSAGYRIYYSISGKKIILLLCGGSKRTQDNDISRAVEYLKNYKEEYK